MQVSDEFSDVVRLVEAHSTNEVELSETQKHHKSDKHVALRWTGWAVLTHPFNSVGNPASAMSPGLCGNGLSVGYQNVGTRYSNAIGFSFSREFGGARCAVTGADPPSLQISEFEQEGLESPTQSQTERKRKRK